MPSPTRGETENEFIHRCVPVRQHEHPEEPQKQSVRICGEMYRDWQKERGRRGAEGRLRMASAAASSRPRRRHNGT